MSVWIMPRKPSTTIRVSRTLRDDEVVPLGEVGRAVRAAVGLDEDEVPCFGVAALIAFQVVAQLRAPPPQSSGPGAIA